MAECFSVESGLLVLVREDVFLNKIEARTRPELFLCGGDGGAIIDAARTAAMPMEPAPPSRTEQENGLYQAFSLPYCRT